MTPQILGPGAPVLAGPQAVSMASKYDSICFTQMTSWNSLEARVR